MTVPRDGWTTNYDDAARIRALAADRPLGGRRKWSTGLSPVGWYFILLGAALTIGVAIAFAT
jgi:hypothetical protein